MNFLPWTGIINFHSGYGCLYSMQFFHGDNKALDAICPIDIAPVAIGLLLKIFMFFNENITSGKLADVLNRRQVCGGKKGFDDLLIYDLKIGRLIL